jgi:hypothetical protein
MSANFRRFNSRVGVVFVFQDSVIRVLSWHTASHTLSFLAIYSFICLHPSLLAALPVILLLFCVLIPSFLARHPAAPSTLRSLSYSASGPPLAPPVAVKPVKELSKDFFRNMRDLQNVMGDFANVHDHVLHVLLPPTNFSDEPLSSTIFVLSTFTAASMFLGSHLIAWRFVFLVAGWILVLSAHPQIADALRALRKTHVEPRRAVLASKFNSWIARDIVLDSPAETREVEFFELQKRRLSGEWEPWLFSASPYDPLCKERIEDQRPRGTRFFEDVRPPAGWTWHEPKWQLDLHSRDWVEERCIGGVEVETQGERWVWDLVLERDGREALASPRTLESGGRDRDSDESVLGKRGDWRRRRWVRVVRRSQLPTASG